MTKDGGDFSVRFDIDDKAIDPNEGSFWLIVSAVFSFLIWGIFSAFYFSRLSAILFTFIIDKYLRLSKNGIYFKIGSISISGFTAGKIMFRNVIYDNGDMTVKVNDGHLIFKFWKPVESRHLQLEKKLASRLQLCLHGLHINLYNNLGKYSEIAKVRQFKWFFDKCNLSEVKKQMPPDRSPPSSVWKNVWNLLGLVQIDVSSGCFLVGNKMLPYALWTRFENLTSKTSVGESENDRALLTIDGDTENVSISLIKNEEYQFSENDKEPPRTTGNDGFMLLQTASLQFVYKQDLLGYVTDDEFQQIQAKVPVWSSEWKFGDNTVLSYGPWAEQQRMIIYSFFFPADYQTAQVTPMPQRGQKRIHIIHKSKIILTKETCMDIWFMRGGQLESIRTRCGKDSTIDMSVLWITTNKGFHWDMQTKFFNFETTTSLLFTKLVECQKLCVNGNFVYPLTWNGEQIWTIDYTFSKATAWFVWDHKRIFTDLINDWLGEDPPDITKFIPFRVYNNLRVVDSFEVIMLLNECNWVDASDKNAENVEAAIVGEKLTFSFELPFTEFLPQVQHVKYQMKGERGVALRTKFPPDSATAPILAALSKLARGSSNAPKSPHGTHSLNKDEWFEIWRTELIEMRFDHQYKPLVLRKNIPSSLPFSVLADYLPKAATHPWNLEPDYLGVEILIEGSEVKFTGLIVKILFELKNNYFGWYDSMTTIDEDEEKDVTKIKSAFDRVPVDAPAEMYRTMNVDVTVRVCNVRAEMLLYSPAVDESLVQDPTNNEAEKCPLIFVEEIVVEVKKTKTQALIQVGVSPACAYLDRASADSRAGCITLSGLQFRGHAMYSSKDVAWDMGVVEYAWIMEVIVGDISGTLDFPSHAFVLHQIVESLLIFIVSPDDATRIPERMQFCHHGQLTKACSIAGRGKNEAKGACDTEEHLKYRQIRISVDSVNLTFVEEKTLVQICADPLRVTVCNAHESRFTEHVCVRVPGITVKQAVRISEKRENVWVEGANIKINEISLDIELPNDKHVSFDFENMRYDFVKLHDEETKRLHFLWVDHSVWGCACYGNTYFFAEIDTIGSSFLEYKKKRKFFVPAIEKDTSLQPMVLQSILEKRKSMLKKQPHLFYKNKSAKNQIEYRNAESMDTESYHSAKSQQNIFNRILPSPQMTTMYAQFVNNLSVKMPENIEMPSFGEPGAIEQWIEAHPPTQLEMNESKKGVNSVCLISKTKSGNMISQVMEKHTKEDDADSVEFDGHRSGPAAARKKKRLAVSGVAATSVDCFLSPIGLEALEKFVHVATNSIPSINPCLLLHMCYRDCVFRMHRQPLTESLFTNNEDAEPPPELEIMLDLPKVNMTLFQCGIKKNVPRTNTNEHVTASIALILIDHAWIQSKSMYCMSGSVIMPTTPLSSHQPHTASIFYQLNCNVITSQLLQITNKDAADFSGPQGSVTSTVSNWDQCAIAQRMADVEPRVMMDFNISDVSVVLERRPIIRKSSPRISTPMNSPAAPQVNKTSSTAPLTTPDVALPPKRKRQLLHEHDLKASVGSVNTSVVMARPQEMTAGDEFPIYEALAPVIVSWMSVLENFIDSVVALLSQTERWRGVAMAKVLKLALDCTDERVAVKVGKNRMLSVRVLGPHQSSCASCLLLKTLFRWFAYDDKAVDAVADRLEIRPEFELEETRKTALMALLSHWQPDVGRELKLVSMEDASRFKVTRPDEAAIAALTKFSKRGRKKKKSPIKETRIVIEPTPKINPPTEKNELLRNLKRGRLSPAPLLRKFRKKAGNDGEWDEEGDVEDFGSRVKLTNEKDGLSLGDIEMQEVRDYSDDEDEEDDEEEKKKNENVDLYTWMRNAQRETALKKRKLAGIEESLSRDSTGIPMHKEKEYINPMDIQQKAYFYAFYRWARLQWTSLDDVENDYIHFDYSVLLKEVDVRMMAKSLKISTDQKKQYITPAQQKVMQMKNAAVNGNITWVLERDEKRKVPLGGQWNISYTGNVEGIRFLIGMATVSLAKELTLVSRAASEARNELHSNSHRRKPSRRRTLPLHNEPSAWDTKVLDMTRDYDKHMQRMRASKTENGDKVKVYVNGTAVVASVVLESVLNDLYVSAMILKIDLSQDKNPIPDGIIVDPKNAQPVSSDERKPPAAQAKKVLPNINIPNKIDDISLSLAKVSLTLSESDSSNKKSDILRCTLNLSTLNFYSKLQLAQVSSTKLTKNSLSALLPHYILTRGATLKLGALEGNMPMAAHSLHDVVMRHGKELEQQFNRLAAQPPTPIGNPTTSFAESPSLMKVQSMESQITQTTLKTNQTSEQSPFRRVPTSSTPLVSKSATTRRVPIVVVNFVLEITSIEMNIQLLPSLQAKYRIYRASSSGVTGDKAKWIISIDQHFFEFCVTAQGKTETFRLQLPSIKCTGHYSIEQGPSQHKPSTDKKLIYREGGSLHMTVVLGSVNHTFTTELLNQLLFAEHSFRAELTSLINRIRSSSSSASATRSPMAQTSNEKTPLGSTPSNAKLSLAIQPQVVEPPTMETTSRSPLLFTIKVLTKDPSTPITAALSDKPSPWLQLTAATPTQTAVRLTIDSLEGELTNKWVVKEEGSRERIYGNAVIHFNAKLGQLVKAAQYDEVSAELQEYATFMTQVRVENKERNMLNSAYSYHISLNRPILLVKAAAIDKAILLWLNYKNTYDFWKNEMDKGAQEKTQKELISATQSSMFSPPQIGQDADMNLSLAINNGMYMCMPLYSYDVTEGMPALVLSLQKSELSVLVKRELTCKASFTGFKLSFVDDFDEQALMQSFLDLSHSEQSNCFFFPEGTYQLCSKASASDGPAKWVLSVSAEMQGIEIDLDQRIGKLTKLLVNTCSMIGKDDDDDMSFWEDQMELDDDEEKVEGAKELKMMKAEERVPWLENKMHEHSRAVFELASKGVSTKKLEAEKHKLRQYELIRFKAFRRNVVEKLRRGANNQEQSRPTTRKNSLKDESKSKTSNSAREEEAAQSGTMETVYFNVDVKVNITSGTCTLRTAKKEGNVQMFPGQLGETMKRLNQGTRDIKDMFQPPTLTTTTFSIPSVEIKAYHVSDPSEAVLNERFARNLKKHLPKDMAKDADDLRKKISSKSRSATAPLFEKKVASSSKRGCFFMFIGLASMPSETVVTPHLATYVEQVLEPLPPSAVFRSQNIGTDTDTNAADHKHDANSDVHNIVAMDTAALPIDFVLYLDVQSSTIRFDGKQQTSRNQAQADCLLTLPRLTLELTTKRSKEHGIGGSYVGGMHISGQFKGFMLKIYNPLEPELDSSRALLLSLDLLSFVISRNKNSSTEPDNRVRFVFTSQIGRASFEYNFRRLGELIQFPKPWYRAAIARRVFFGDQAPARPRDDASDVTGTTRSRIPEELNKRNQKPAQSVISSASGSAHQRKPWTAMVLAAIQWNEFEVTAFMSNTMGKTTWNVTKGLLAADAKLNSQMERDVTVTFKLGSSELIAKEGAISGCIKLNNFKITAAHALWIDVKKPPINKAKLRLEWITANIEWMSRRVLIAKWSNPSFNIYDYYNGVKEGDEISLASLGINVKSSWKDLQMVITKTTVEDIIAIINRLVVFFDEQLKNSRILLGNFGPSANLSGKKLPDVPTEPRKPSTHFWEHVLDYVSEMQINQQLMPLMKFEGARVGGNVELEAGGISLVLMKGDMNAETWAVFHLRDARIVFIPEAKMDFLDPETKENVGILLKQEFRLKLGSREENKTDNLANVCRVQTRYHGLRHLQKVDEILEYFIGDVMKTLGFHHSMLKKANEEGKSLSGIDKSSTSLSSFTSYSQLRGQVSGKDSKTASSPPKGTHNVLELFQFPGLEAKMTSEQLNGLDDGDKYEAALKMPMEVFTTFVCDFYGDVAVETNFNAQVSFLPELLKSYLKESSTTSSQTTSSSLTSPAVTPKSSSKESVNSEAQKDPRVFICREWLVEPRVRFIDRFVWRPPVVDDILKKLQIFDHRNTIPKVIQRAVLDPLDAALASSMVAALNLIDNKHTIKKFKKAI
ncbi:unnamed protein product [Caenorhabditis bovis]|uniref:Bridge-like lipid transfer protein family member 1 C-terminal domain-containing protein n=1 Tax=Caenorhabditis bovis TaxID=2654633 RepID=A0A8S1FDS2_9PELO|nr:unnamed protein product [Caenorhabditis bovis]